MFKKSVVHGAISTILTVGVAVAITACGSSSTGSSATSTSYAGPGSKWDVDLNSDNSFLITKRASINAAVDFGVTGTYENLASGFLKLTVGSVTGTGGPTVGDVGYALDIPGYAFVLKPLDASSDQVISMVKGGNCPTTDVDANWVMVKSDGAANDPSRDFFGTFNYVQATGVPSLPFKYNLSAFTTVAGGGLSGTGSCADGIMSVTDAVMYLTDNGGAIVHIDSGTPADATDDQFVFALSQKSVPSLVSLDGNYAGLLFDASNASGSMIEPVSMTCNTGACTASVFSSNAEIDSNSPTGGSATINLTAVDSPRTGFLTGDINAAGALACMADINAVGSGKNIVSCVGQSPGDNTKMFNVLFVSK